MTSTSKGFRNGKAPTRTDNDCRGCASSRQPNYHMQLPRDANQMHEFLVIAVPLLVVAWAYAEWTNPRIDP